MVRLHIFPIFSFLAKMKISEKYATRGAGGVEAHQILTDQLSLSQPGGTDYAHHVTTGPPGFSDLPTALLWNYPILT